MKWYLWGKTQKKQIQGEEKGSKQWEGRKDNLFFIISFSESLEYHGLCFQTRKGQLKHTFCSKTAQAIANVSNIFKGSFEMPAFT